MMQLEKQKGKPREKTLNGKNQQLAEPSQTLTHGGHEIAGLLNKNEQAFFIIIYMIKQTRLNWENKTLNKKQLPDEV